MRKRISSESENSVTQIVVEEETLYKDHKVTSESITSKFFNIIKKSENTSKTPLTSSSSYNTNNYLNREEEDYLTSPDPVEEIFVMTARDRSAEFSTCIRSLQGRNIDRVVNLKDPKKVKQMQNYAEFMTTAKMIGKNIASTYTKLEKLTLCKLIHQLNRIH